MKNTVLGCNALYGKDIETLQSKVMLPSSGLKRTIFAIMTIVTIKCRELLDQLMNCQLLKDVFRGFNVVSYWNDTHWAKKPGRIGSWRGERK